MLKRWGAGLARTRTKAKLDKIGMETWAKTNRGALDVLGWDAGYVDMLLIIVVLIFCSLDWWYSVGKPILNSSAA